VSRRHIPRDSLALRIRGQYRQAAGAVEPPSEVGSAMRRNSDVRFWG